MGTPSELSAQVPCMNAIRVGSTIPPQLIERCSPLRYSYMDGYQNMKRVLSNDKGSAPIHRTE